MICSIKRLACILLVGFISILLFSAAHADFNISDTNPQPGDTIYFNGSECLRSDSRYFIKMPSGSYILEPEYLEHSQISANFDCPSRTSPYLVNGSIAIPEDFIAGSYDLSINTYNWKYKGITDKINGFNFTIGNSTEVSWTMDSDPIELPLGDQDQFGDLVKTDKKNIASIEKIFNLTDLRPMLLYYIAENKVSCDVNGQSISSLNNVHFQENVRYCTDYKSKKKYTSYYTGGWYDDYIYDDSSMHEGYKIADISPFLIKGENTVTCTAETYSSVLKREHKPNKWTYADGRLYLDAKLVSLQENDVLWSKSNGDGTLNDMKSNNPLYNKYEDYSCVKWKWNSGNGMNYYKYRETGLMKENVYWSPLPLNDNSVFFLNPKMYLGYTGTMPIISPYNGVTVDIRKYEMTDEVLTKELQISETKQPTCYLNGKAIILSVNNDAYWNYKGNVNLNEGVNIIACKSTSAAANNFDIRTVPINLELEISNVTLITEGNEATFSIDLNHIAHPDTDTNVILQIEKDGELLFEEMQNIDFASTDITVKNVDLWEKYHKEYYDSEMASRCYRSSGKMFDKHWGTYGDKRNCAPWVSEKITLDFLDGVDLKEYNITQLDWVYSPYGVSSLYFYDYESNNWDFIQSDDNHNIHVLTVPVAPQYISNNGEIWANITDARRYYEGVFNVDADLLKERTAEVIDSQGQIDFIYIFDEPGIYDFQVTSMDLIDGDTDTFYSQVELNSDIFGSDGKIGFIPLSGSEKDTKSNGKIGIIIGVITSIAAIGAAGAGIYATGSSNPRPLKRLSGSLARAERAMSKLSTAFTLKKHSNSKAIWANAAKKLNAFKLFKEGIEGQKQLIKKLLKEQEMLRKAKEKQRALKEQMKSSLVKQKPMTWEEWYAIQGVEMPETRKNPRKIKPIAWPVLEKQGRDFKEKHGLSEDTHLGNTLEEFRRNLQLNNSVDMIKLIEDNKEVENLFKDLINPSKKFDIPVLLLEELGLDNDLIYFPAHQTISQLEIPIEIQLEWVKKVEENQKQIQDALNGFIMGYDPSNQGLDGLFADILSGVLVYGDLRDIAFYFAQENGIDIGPDSNELVLTFAFIGLLTTFSGPGDAVSTVLKNTAKRLGKSKAINVFGKMLKKTNLIPNLAKALKENPKLIGKMPELLSSFAKYAEKAGVDKAAKMFEKIDFKKLDSSFFKLLDESDDPAELLTYINKADDVTAAANRLAKLKKWGVSNLKINQLIKLPIVEFSTDLKTQTLKELDYVLSLKNEILSQMEKAKQQFGEFELNKIEFFDIETRLIKEPYGGAFYNILALNIDKTPTSLINRNTLLHEMAHLKIDQSMFSSLDQAESFSKSLSRTEEKMYTQLHEFMADMSLGVHSGTEILNSRIPNRWDVPYNPLKAVIDEIMGNKVGSQEIISRSQSAISKFIDDGILTNKQYTEMKKIIQNTVNSLESKNFLNAKKVKELMNKIGKIVGDNSWDF